MRMAVHCVHLDDIDFYAKFRSFSSNPSIV